MNKENYLSVGYSYLWDFTVPTCCSEFWLETLVSSAAEGREAISEPFTGTAPQRGKQVGTHHGTAGCSTFAHLRGQACSWGQQGHSATGRTSESVLQLSFVAKDAAWCQAETFHGCGAWSVLTACGLEMLLVIPFMPAPQYYSGVNHLDCQPSWHSYQWSVNTEEQIFVFQIVW